MNAQTSVPIQASVGRLGIITRVKFPIVPQAAVKRELSMLSIEEFAKELTQVQEDYIAAKAAGTTDALNKAFLPISEVQVWHPHLDQALLFCCRHLRPHRSEPLVKFLVLQSNGRIFCCMLMQRVMGVVPAGLPVPSV